MTDKAVIEGLKNNNSNALEFIYVNHRLAFTRFAKKYSLSEDVIIDVYQDAIIALREKALNGKLDHLDSQLNTYLFGIGKYLIYAKLRQRNKMSVVEDIENIDFEEDILDDTNFTDRQKQLNEAFKRLGKKCKSILTLFYYRGFDIEEIKNELDYSSKDVVKSQKSRCIKSLKEMIFKR